MEDYKINNFIRSDPSKTFPTFESLSGRQCESLRTAVAESLGVPKDARPLQVLEAIAGAPHVTRWQVPADGKPPLGAMLVGVGVTESTKVFINWYRFDSIDQMLLGDLERHFDDIWYPGADDIEIFDLSCSWFLTVSHDGVVDLVRPGDVPLGALGIPYSAKGQRGHSDE